MTTPRIILLNTKYLTLFGISVDIAYSTNEGISMLLKKNESRQHYDVIISDMGRGIKNNEGERFLKKIRKEHNIHVPVIFYVGKYDPNDGIPSYSFGMTSSREQLLHYIMDALERQQELSKLE